MNKRTLNHLLFLMIAIIICFVSCNRKNYRTSPNIIIGKASWYGPQFHGGSTSSKEIFDMYDMTAAHKTLPFGTYVMVTNLNNGKSVKVKINDRGPFIKGRILDLSYAAAKILDMVEPGVVPVRIEIINNVSRDFEREKFAVQVGSFVLRKNAVLLKSRLNKEYKNVYISKFRTPQRIYYRVRLSFHSKIKAFNTAKVLQKQGFDVFIVEAPD